MINDFLIFFIFFWLYHNKHVRRFKDTFETWCKLPTLDDSHCYHYEDRCCRWWSVQGTQPDLESDCGLIIITVPLYSVIIIVVIIFTIIITTTIIIIHNYTDCSSIIIIIIVAILLSYSLIIIVNLIRIRHGILLSPHCNPPQVGFNENDTYESWPCDNSIGFQGHPKNPLTMIVDVLRPRHDDWMCGFDVTKIST